ncbi:MAG: PcfJ domain-containing protein [Lachnospiraceae bacterium]|nr:PcfJ domain-containing protein [Lachnospiraceae bacterium]
MIKKELEKLRTLNATEGMIQALKAAGQETPYAGCKNAYKYRYHLAARCQQLNGILKVSICTREDIEAGIRGPKWDIYLNYEGNEYITRERQKDGSYKWRTSMIQNLDAGYYWQRDYDKYMYINAEGERSIQAILETKNKGYQGIREWQQARKKRIEDEKIKKLTDQWDAEMEPIKDPPPGFEEWWHHKAFDGENYIYYAGAGAKEGYCTSCLDMVTLTTDPKHLEEGSCPKCKTKIHYISRAKRRNDVWARPREVSCVQRYKDGLVQRNFSVRRVDKKDERQINRVEFIISEYERNLIFDNSYKKYKYDDYKRRGMRWCLDSKPRVYRKDDQRMYRKNVKQLLKKIHTSYATAVDHGYKSGLIFFLHRENKYPVIEKVYKAGLYTLGKEIVENAWSLNDIKPDETQRELGKMLRIDKARLQRLKQMNGNVCALLWLQEEKRENTIYRDDDIKTLASAEIEPDTMHESKVFHYLSIEKICNYLIKQKRLRPEMKLESIWNDWNDYISMMKKMKMDCSKELLLKPKDLQVAHNELVAMASMKDAKKEIKKKEKEFKEAQKLLESGELKKYEYQDKHYCIVAPEGITDIYQEGMILKHCIHTCDIYFQRIDIRETYLLFLRRTEDPKKPWYTLEIEPGGNIRQKKSVLNKAYKDLEPAMPFLRKWQKWVQKNLSKEDKELAEKSDQARKDGYRKLREEKKIIWHGELQGTLLADALEDDFMEAIG